ncbi:GIY-YIG catalytic domain-containing endonuclease [Acanthocystis turfacea Chlorella virus Canal-1]|nr:GIY-YIG catalytic domain-containing endonuclease [Acanthocystis turfacea Chlorella virus Canal-1]
MIIKKKRFEISKLYFVLDNVMFWEAFRWERFDMGHIYIQKFSNGKMYTGLTIDLKRRMGEYLKFKGSNKHHTNALKKYIDTMQISFTQCPNYLLDAVEIFVISFFDLTDPTKGYNKTTGGRKGYRMLKETRMRMSESKKGKKNSMYGRSHTEEARTKISILNTGRRRSEEERAKLSYINSGENHHNFGKTTPEEVRAKISKSMIGKTHTEEARKKLSDAAIGDKNHKSKPICVFGKLYDSASTASKILCDVCVAKNIRNMIKRKKHQHNVFYVSKEFYKEMRDTTEIVTRDMYESWND